MILNGLLVTDHRRQLVTVLDILNIIYDQVPIFYIRPILYRSYYNFLHQSAALRFEYYHSDRHLELLCACLCIIIYYSQ